MGCCSAKPNEKSGVVFSTNYRKAPGYLTKFELVDARSSFESFCSLARSHLAASPIQLLPVACLAVLGDPASYHGEEKQAAVSGGINAAEDLPTAWRNRMSLLTPLSEAVDTAAKAEKVFPRVLFVHSEGSEGAQKIPLLIEATSRFLKAYNLEGVAHEDKLQYIWSPALCTTLCESRKDPQALASQMLTAAHAASVFLAPPAALYPATAATLLAPPPPPPPGPPGGGGGAASPRTPLLAPGAGGGGGGGGGRGRWEAWSAPLSSSSLLADQLAAGRWGPGQLATAAALARRAPFYHAQVIQSSNGGVQFSFDCSIGEEGYADLMKKAKRRHQRWDMVYGTAPNLKARVNHPRAIVRSGHDILLNPQVLRLLQLLRADVRDLDQLWWPPGGEGGEGGGEEEEEEASSSSPRTPPGGGGGGGDAGTGTGARLAPAAAAGVPPPPAAAKLEERRRRKREAIRQHQNTIRRAVVAAGPPAALARAAAGLMDAWASLPPGGPGGGPWGERAPLARAWGETGGWPPPPPPPPGEEELRPGQLAGGEEVADHDANASAEHAINALDNQDKDDPEARAAFYGALLFLTAYHEGMLKTKSEDTLQASYQYCPEPKTGMFQRSLDEYNSEESSTQKQITEHFAHNLFERGGGVGRSLVQFLSNSTPKPTPRQSPKARDAVAMAGQEGEAKESAAATAMLAAAETNRPKGGQPWGSLLAGEEGRRGEFSGSGSGSTDWGPPGSETSELVKEKGKGVLANWFGVPSPATCGTACNVRWQQILRKQSHESSSSSSGSDCSGDEQHEQKDEEEHNTLSPASPLARGCPPEEAEEEQPRPPGREEEQLEEEEEEVDERLVAQLQELLRPEPRSGLALAARALFGGGGGGGEEGRRQRRRAGEGAAAPPPRLTFPPVADRRYREPPPRPDHRPRGALTGDGTGAEVMIVRSADL